MSKCICEDNWNNFVKVAEPLIGNKYAKGNITWKFIGVLWSDDDYYWTFQKTCGCDRGQCMFVTCVLSFERVLEIYEMVPYEA